MPQPLSRAPDLPTCRAMQAGSRRDAAGGGSRGRRSAADAANEARNAVVFFFFFFSFIHATADAARTCAAPPSRHVLSFAMLFLPRHARRRKKL